MSKVDDREIEQFLEKVFDENYEHLHAETGRGITPAMRQLAWEHVRAYWRRMKAVAEKVTETEVRLSLPSQISPTGRQYTIEGVVDVVREGDETIIYDLKTHNPDIVMINKEAYAGQLNVYAHIWQKLRGSTPDDIAIIATEPPAEVRKALQENDKDALEQEMANWDPVVRLNFDQNAVDKCVTHFGQVVDNIENGRFVPPAPEVLGKKKPGQKAPFGTAVCRHCDARFSCRSYEKYMASKGRKKTDVIVSDGSELEAEREDFLETMVDAETGV